MGSGQVIERPGAGRRGRALGNEIVKNLALLGVGNVLVADRDSIEHSNLSRSVLFRDSDIGRPKSIVAVEAARTIYPGIHAHAFVGDVINAFGLGAFRWADLVISGLDNREARLHLSRVCNRLGKPWIDGAIEHIQGVARTFLPDASAPCYECTMTARDWELVNQRRSCNMLTREQMLTGHTPTTPTISSIIAGVQTQEAVKLIHGMDSSLAGRGFVFMGSTCETFTVEYQRKNDCLGHEAFQAVVSIDACTDTLTLRELLSIAQARIGRPSRDARSRSRHRRTT
ncbi:MAG: ThiF family adenylyltransferase [Tepidisphaeraceae bacterium]